MKWSFAQNGINRILANTKIILVIYIVATIAVSLQLLTLGKKNILPTHPAYTQYNNYVIFKQSHFHLIEGKDLYKLYLDECWDYYKYSPAFSLLFGMFAYFPDIIGLSLWNLLNALLLFLSIRYLPHFSNQKKNSILFFVLIELITSLQNSQSNGLMAALIIFTFNFLENKKYLWATLCVVFSIFIKIFGGVAFVLFIFYPDKWKLILYSIFWTIVFFFLPLLVVTHHQLLFLYERWWILLGLDHAVSNGLSVMNWLNIWFNLTIKKNIVLLFGMMLFLLPLIRIKQYKNFQFKLLLLASCLLWIVIFNHKAESPTFIIAICGIAIWFFSEHRKWFDAVLVIIAFIFTSLSVTDIFPPFVRTHYFIPIAIKVTPCIFVWIKIMYELLVEDYPN
jgi:hypothetical protein